jgi:UDPglucose--hexose-1-phosphate uridylyltransferase
MELRKDPITRSWVVVGEPTGRHAEISALGQSAAACSFCPEHESDQPPICSYPSGGPWQVRVVPHEVPLYHIEGEVARRAEGIYDRMGTVGAHEVIIETPRHDQRLSQLSDEHLGIVLKAYAERIADLKKDLRFKYVTISKDQGPLSGADWAHAHSEVMATTFVPRRILYELRSSRNWFAEKERCVFCDIVQQEERRGKRVVDSQGDYVALCPYASRVPYEVWVLNRKHNHLFEHCRPGANRRNLAALLGRVLRRVERVAQGYHLTVHTAPNTDRQKGELADYWTTIAEDYHWHIEILPLLASKPKSYKLKEIYQNPLEPEQAAERLRAADPGYEPAA